MNKQNTFQDNLGQILENLEKIGRAMFLESVAEAFVEKADTLRDGTEFGLSNCRATVTRPKFANRMVVLHRSRRKPLRGNLSV